VFVLLLHKNKNNHLHSYHSEKKTQTRPAGFLNLISEIKKKNCTEKQLSVFLCFLSGKIWVIATTAKQC